MSLNFNFDPMRTTFLLLSFCYSLIKGFTQDHQIATFELINTLPVDKCYNTSVEQIPQEDDILKVEGQLPDGWYLEKNIYITLRVSNRIVVNNITLIQDGAEVDARLDVSKSTTYSKSYKLTVVELLVTSVDCQRLHFIYKHGHIYLEKDDNRIEINATPKKDYFVNTDFSKDSVLISQHGNVILRLLEQLEQDQISNGQILNFEVANDVMLNNEKIISKGASASCKIIKFQRLMDGQSMYIYIEPDWVETVKGRKPLKQSKPQMLARSNEGFIPIGYTVTVEL